MFRRLRRLCGMPRSLPQRLDNRVSSSSALSQARRNFLRYLSLVLVHCINVVRTLQFYARVVVELELRYVQRPLLLKRVVATCGYWSSGTSRD